MVQRCVLQMQLRVETRRPALSAGSIAPALVATKKSPRVRFKARNNRLAPEGGP